MKKTSAAALLAATAGAVLLASGSAQADVPAFYYPFLQPGCMCAGLLPGQSILIDQDHGIGMTEHTIIPLGRHDPVAYVGYTNVAPDPEIWNQLVADALNGSDPAVLGTFHGIPSVTVTHLSDKGITYVDTAFLDGNRAVDLVGAGTNPADAQGAHDSLLATFQIL